ncbi:MAG: hypothetical protein LC747_01360, partial [Acidobacteria bacterium]|nr:hypothetical protein [Acidobacteriota bacterium]
MIHRSSIIFTNEAAKPTNISDRIIGVVASIQPKSIASVKKIRIDTRLALDGFHLPANPLR